MVQMDFHSKTENHTYGLKHDKDNDKKKLKTSRERFMRE